MGFVNRLFHRREEVAFFVQIRYNHKRYIVREVIKLKKRLLALLLATAVLFSFAVTFADEWDDEDFQHHDEWIDGYLARVMQHEFDHLDGKMFVDHISPLRKQLIQSKLRALVQGRYRCGYKTKPVRR